MSPAAEALLAPDEPAAAIDYRATGASPFLLVCDHAGRRIPRSLHNLGLAPSDLARHIAWDISIAGVGRALADRLDACLIMQPYSRLVIDCNRPPGGATSIVPVSDGTPIAGNENLSGHDAALRLRDIFTPYHRTIADALDTRAKARRQTILISLHSFTPVFAGFARPWQAGVLYHRYGALAEALLALLHAPGDLVVGDNEPYDVTDDTDYTIPVHGEQHPRARRAARHSACRDRNSPGFDR
jgi:predicted N-formylglutamate amidohydrolase